MGHAKIVVLDGHTLNPGDLSWESLEAIGDLTVHARTPPEQILERAADATIVLTNKVQLDRKTLERLSCLRCIGVLATGFNGIDIQAATECGIVVTNVPAYSTRSVAQSVLAHLLNLTLRTAEHAAAVRAGRWASAADWCFWDYPLQELDGMTMGIIGLGQIGQATAKLAEAFGMKVIAGPSHAHRDVRGISRVGLETLFSESDVVSLHCPLTEATYQLVNRERLALMKPTAYLINTGRGPLLDEVAVAEALNTGRLAGAGLDVVSVEPPDCPNPLFSAKNCFVTPHHAWATIAARRRLMATAADNIAAFLRGEPQNVVH